MGSAATSSWTEIVSKKRSLREQALAPYLVDDLDQRPPRVQDVSTRSRIDEDVQRITDIDNIGALLDRLTTGEFTAESVVQAYIRRATVAHQLTNSITEVLFDDALQQAKVLDDEFKRTGKLKGPLHGIPITLKDQFNVRGYDTTLGYVGRSFQPATEDAILVQILKKLGAIIIAKTNLPQSIMWAETDNPLWGRTDNPRNPDLTPGGSTGGEAALLALHGTLLGFGTDIGGSIRIPQAMVGCYGLKPSSNRFPYHGVSVSMDGQEHVPSSIGPMTRDLSSLYYVTRSIIADAKPWTLDPKCVPLPWNDQIFHEIQSRPLVIGLILDDGVVRVHPPIERALLELRAKLESHGHEFVVWDTSDHAEYIRLMDSYYTIDGGEDIRRDVEVGGEPFVPHVEALVNRGKAISVYEYWQLNRLKAQLQKRYLDKWNGVRTSSSSTSSGSGGRQVDILLSPTLPHTAILHRKVRWVGYTKIWNLLDYTAMTFPVDRVRADEDACLPPYEPRNELDRWNWELYDLDLMKDHPVNLQIIGKRWEEEKVLGAAMVIERIWRDSRES